VTADWMAQQWRDGKRTKKKICAYVYRLTHPVVVSSAISAEETIPVATAISERDVMRALYGAEWKPIQVFSAIPTDTYEAVVEYKDTFGNIFRTVHSRGIYQNPIPDTRDQA
jgi:hypothetical protein